MEDLGGWVYGLHGPNNGDRGKERRRKWNSYLVGKSGRELLDTLMSDTDKDTWKVDSSIKKYYHNCNPSVNKTVERYHVFTKNHNTSETIDSFVTELKL